MLIASITCCGMLCSSHAGMLPAPHTRVSSIAQFIIIGPRSLINPQSPLLLYTHTCSGDLLDPHLTIIPCHGQLVTLINS